MYRTTLSGILRRKLIGETCYSNKPAFLSTFKMFSNKEEDYAIMKPPNIFIFNEGNEKGQFEEISRRLYRCLRRDSYIIYPLTPTQITQSIPWKDNCVLLVVYYSTNLTKEVQQAFTSYYERGGSVLSVCSDLNLPGINVEKIETISRVTSLEYENKVYEIDKGFPLTYKATISDGSVILGKYTNIPLIIKSPSNVNTNYKALISLIDIFREQTDISKNILQTHFNMHVNCNVENVIPNVSKVYLTSNNSQTMYKLEKYVTQKERKISLTNSTLFFDLEKSESCEITSTQYDVNILTNYNDIESFDVEKYYKMLKTRHLGQAIMYGEVVNSTMDLLDGFSVDFGLVAIAKVQIGGKGRGGNKWLSPEGCAMFTYQLSIPLKSRLGQSISYVQHLTTIAIVHSIRKESGYEDLPLNIKWPNDIYNGKKSKIGGVLVNSILYSDTIICYVGCGVNLCNKHPTICINSLIEEKGKGHLDIISWEGFIAGVLNTLEELINDFQKGGSSTCLPLYYRYWIHEGQELKLNDTEKKVVVWGLDDYGYLSVISKETNEILSLQPDGNGLDMMKNLLIMK